MPLAPGSCLDSYEIVAPLGAGGMGEVYRARDATLKRDVAVKVLPEYWSRDPERLRRFEQEAQATAALNHPNIVSIFHVGRHEGSPYIVTELLQGETLRERLRKGPMRLREVLDYGRELARGLAAAHDAGIVHRDLKPENTWITKDGRIKILDFGLAKFDLAKTASADGATVSGQRSSPGQVLGTVGYMSPEQVRGQIADARSDIFAAGVVLYEMLTGKPAFRKATAADTMSAILNEDPLSVSQIAPNVPPGLQRVVTRCLAKNPAQRIQHASDLEFALEALSDSGGSSIAVARQSSRARWLWGAAVVVLILGAALFAWWKMPPSVPVIESVTQLTDDGEAKEGAIQSDASRVYFNEGLTGSWKIAQVSVTGGPTAPVVTKLPNPQITSLALDGSELLAFSGGIDVPTSPLWSIPLPAGEPRRLGNIDGQFADFLRDGRIVFSTTKELYLADKDGSNLRKLYSGAGGAWNPAVSPDDTRVAFTTMTDGKLTLAEIAPDGTNFRVLLKGACCARWSPDGNYLVYRVRHAGASDIWALPMQTGIFHRSRLPIRLTNGPLAYNAAAPSRDGNHILAIGTKRRGELVRYDMKSNLFVPFLSGTSAIDPTFSRDGQWVAYISYPEHTLWRSRSDGSERMQLTYPPMEAAYPSISPDGTKVVFSNFDSETFIVGMDGGQPQRIVERHSGSGNWSPDGNLLAVISWGDGAASERPNSYLQIYDLRTGKLSTVPASQELSGAHWINQDTLVATNRASTELMTFDFQGQKWNELAVVNLTSWNLSPDRKYIYFTTGGTEPEARRLRLSDRHIETIASMKDLRRVMDMMQVGRVRLNVAPDGSPVFTRDIGSQEIYALTVRWP